MCLPPDLDERVFGIVRSSIADALALDPDEVLFESRLIDDLGAESLDLLDIVYRLERAFDITIPRGGIEKMSREAMGGEAYEVDGVLTEGALARIAEAMPEVPRGEIGSGLKSADVPYLFRVGTFYHLVLRILAEQG